MITANRHRAQPASDAVRPSWQQLWRDAVTDPAELLALVGLADRAADLLPARDTGFALRVPRGFVARMRHGDPNDPLLRQVLPLAAELDDAPGFTRVAVGDMAARSAHGMLQKYQGRALLIATGSCAINCRYCFRRHFPYADETAAANRWQAAIAALAADPGVDEAILSGGDPLSLSNAKLAEFTAAIASMPRIRRVRLHTRLPVVLPERVDAGLCDLLAALPQRVAVVLHANHANEFDGAVATACRRLADAGALLLNQSVLLRGVNDDAETLAALSERLIDCGVLPYYLHQLDRVQGAAHYEVDDQAALEIVETLRNRLPGYLVPKLVREVAGAPAKTPL
ncbi:MAG TPA: EF-P beta-lysylation protein EpmB [Tahibacter sp.]|nr:EF-P beta-lysylation protein EpmB [Tahibacter sp.]